MTVRENQKELSEQFEKIFKIAEPASINTGIDAGHSRVEIIFTIATQFEASNIDAGHSRVEIRKYTVLWII